MPSSKRPLRRSKSLMACHLQGALAPAAPTHGEPVRSVVSFLGCRRTARPRPLPNSGSSRLSSKATYTGHRVSWARYRAHPSPVACPRAISRHSPLSRRSRNTCLSVRPATPRNACNDRAIRPTSTGLFTYLCAPGRAPPASLRGDEADRLGCAGVGDRRAHCGPERAIALGGSGLLDPTKPDLNLWIGVHEGTRSPQNLGPGWTECACRTCAAWIHVAR